MEDELREIAALVAAGERRLGIRSEDLQSVTPDQVRLDNMRWDLRLAARALSNLLERLNDHRDASGVALDEDSSEEDRLAASERLHTVTLDSELLMRQIYELLYAIQILVDRLEDRSMVPSASELEELERLCVFRGSLLVHRESAVPLSRGGRTWDAGGLTVRFVIALQSVGEEDGLQVEQLFARTCRFLPEDRRGEEDWHEQLQLLYDHWLLIPTADRDAAAALIRRNGVKSDPPVVLARMVTALVRRAFPPIAERRQG